MHKTIISIISDTHGILDKTVEEYLSKSDIIIHAGDEIITVTHGDQFGSMPSHSKLRDTFPDSKLIIYGHTHFQIFDDSESPWVMNPGASGHTRNMNGGPCFSQIHIDNGMWNIKQYCFN